MGHQSSLLFCVRKGVFLESVQFHQCKIFHNGKGWSKSLQLYPKVVYIGSLSLVREERRVNLDEKDTLTGRLLHELEMFSLRPGMYGSTRVFLSSSPGSLLWMVLSLMVKSD